ncbi:serine/threonine-protein kinase pkn1 [Candidatus Uabimicrobium amorphum]|uniref:Serine/threonine-protein kinase pkn1 n=1 Tax=Uabimicrobium amorphum TaxID=2596890 RepID=A0A5S9IHR7_UABAM|nr:serine/threonine-protein kinase pkn1 [Candidatus Uabimicrobium amorphum]
MGYFAFVNMKKILMIMMLIGFVCAKDDKITFSVYCKAYNKNLGSKAKYIDKMIRQVVPQEMTNYIPAKNTLSVMRKFYKGVKPTASYLYKSFKIRPNFRKWLKSKGVDYLIICGMNISRKPKSLILFYRILPVNSEGDETKFVRSRTWKGMQKRVAQLLQKSMLAKHVEELKSGKSDNENKGWFNEELPSGLAKSKVPGQYVWQQDLSTMVYVPGGSFEQQEIPGYYIDKYEVNNEQFCKFLNSNKDADVTQWIDMESTHSLIQSKDGSYVPKEGCELYPVVEVSWLGAEEYCKWAGKALPSKNQWLKSFHGGEQIPDIKNGQVSLVDNPLQQRTFPWGEEAPDLFVYRCNYHPQKADADGYGWLAPTIAFDGLGDSPYFCSNLSGNVWEWTADEEAEQRFCYGGSWNSGLETLKKPIEVSSEETKSDIGFRSVLTTE